VDIGALGLFGIFMNTVGGVWYAQAEYHLKKAEKEKRSKPWDPLELHSREKGGKERERDEKDWEKGAPDVLRLQGFNGENMSGSVNKDGFYEANKGPL
jgi:hypothetical protein